jgi:hypothetical protein
MGVYDRSSYDSRIDYRRPVPPPYLAWISSGSTGFRPAAEPVMPKPLPEKVSLVREVTWSVRSQTDSAPGTRSRLAC